MGSWDESCVISRVGLKSGYRTVGLVVEETKFREILFRCAPVRGTYDNYGGIDLDPDSKFPKGFSNEDKLDRIIFLEESIFDFYTKNTISEYGNCDPASCLLSYPYSEALELIGFEKVGEQDGRYKHLYKHPSSDIIVASDGTWCNFLKNSLPVKTKNGLYTINAFVSEWESLTEFKLDVSNLDPYSTHYFTVWKDLENFKKINDLFESYGETKGYDLHLKMTMERFGITPSFYKDSVAAGHSLETIAMNMAMLLNLRLNSQCLNVNLTPTPIGIQCKQDSHVKRLAEQTIAIIDSRRKEEEDDED